MYEISTVGKFVETESKLKLPGERDRGLGSYLMVTELLLAVIESFRNR